MPSKYDVIEKLPNELLLRIMGYLYPPAAFQAFDVGSICPKDSVWHELLLSAHLDMVSVSEVSRSFHSISVNLAQCHARLITEEKKSALILHEMKEAGLKNVQSTQRISNLGRLFILSITGACPRVVLDGEAFQAATHEKINSLAVEEEAEPFNPLSWFDIGYNHARRAVRCRKIMSLRGLRLNGAGRDSLIPRFETLSGWRRGGPSSERKHYTSRV